MRCLGVNLLAGRRLLMFGERYCPRLGMVGRFDVVARRILRL